MATERPAPQAVFVDTMRGCLTATTKADDAAAVDPVSLKREWIVDLPATDLPTADSPNADRE